MAMCGSNDFQDYFDDAKESRVKQVPKNQESKSFKNQVSKNQDWRTIKFQDSRFKNQVLKNQDSRLKIQDKLISRFKRRNREATIKTSQGKYFSKIQT